MSSDAASSRHGAGAAPLLPRTPAHDFAHLRLWLEPLLISALAFAVRAVWLDADLHFDELYHLLAAEGWLASGEPRIHEGVYERGYLFTVLVATSLEVFGDSIPAARLPSLVAGTSLVVALFLWTRAQAGSLAAWLAGGLLALSTLAVELAYFTRFYAIQTVALYGAALITFRLASAHDRAAATTAWAVLALGLAALAINLHKLSLIFFAGLAFWLAGALAYRHWPRLRTPRRRFAAVAVAAIAVAGPVGLAYASGVLDQLLTEYRWAPLWAAGQQDKAHFYHARMLANYPFLWPLTPVLALAALGCRPCAAGFCLTVFASAFVLLSFGGMKTDRYLAPGYPFLFAVWGIGIAALAGHLRSGLHGLADRAGANLPALLPGRLTRAGLIGACLAFLFASSGEPFTTVRALASGTLPHAPGRNVIASGWPQARAALESRLDHANLVLVTDELAALRFLGRADLVLNATRKSELDDGAIARDPRTGLPVTASEAAVRRAIACHASGLVVVPAFDLDAAWTVPPAAARTLVDLTMEVEAPGLAGLRVFTWQHAPADCADPLFSGA